MGLWDDQQEEHTLNRKCEVIKFAIVVRCCSLVKFSTKKVQCRDSLVAELVENFNSMTIYTCNKKIKCKNYVLGIDETY